MCPFSSKEEETLDHIFWRCSAWDAQRMSYLTPRQLEQSQMLPLCTQRAGLFLQTPEQLQQMVRNHQTVLNGLSTEPLLPHWCDFALEIQRSMVDIINARNNTSSLEALDDFDPTPYFKPARNATNVGCKIAKSKAPVDNPAPELPKVRPTHSPEGFLYSTSNRPGSLQYQYVQYNKKNKTYHVAIPHQGKRHSYGPFQIDTDAARKVREFLQTIEAGRKLPTRGEKRTDKFHNQLSDNLDKLNTTAEAEKRHFVTNPDNPTCKFCHQTVHTYHAMKFAQRTCHALSDTVDKKI